MRSPLLVVLALSAIFGLRADPCAGQAAKGLHPGAVVRPADNIAFALTDEGTMLAVDMEPAAGKIVARFSFTAYGFPADLTYGVSGSQKLLFVAMNSSLEGVVQGRVQAFTLDGHPGRSWIVRHVVSGLGFDASTGTLYFATADSAEVYSVNPQTDAAPVFLTGVPGAGKLGPITVDPSQHRVYVSDSEQGNVTAVDLATKHLTPIGRVATPSALLLASDGTQIYIADNGRKQVVSISLTPPGTMRPLTSPNAFKSPSGLAWADATHLIVADELAATLSLLDLTGHKVYSLPLR